MSTRPWRHQGVAVIRERERPKAIWSEPLAWVAREGGAPARGEAVPLALLPAPCWLREHALASMTRLTRQWQLAFTGSSMASVRAAVSAGLGVSIVPLSSVLPGMEVLPRGRDYPAPGRLDVGVVRGPKAPKDIVDVLERVIRQTLEVIAVGRAAT